MTQLPKRWRFRHGAYSYQVPKRDRHLWDGKSEFRLGKTEAEAWRTWYSRLALDVASDIQTMNQLFDHWLLTHVDVKLTPDTQKFYRECLKKLRLAFGEMRPADIEPIHAYAYMNKRGAKVMANREVSALKAALTHGVSIGVLRRNELIGQVRRQTEEPRDRLPTNEELAAFLEIAPKLRGYVALKRITGLRKAQLLTLDVGRQYKDGVLTVKGKDRGGKKGRDTRYHGETLEAVIEWILYQRHGVVAIATGRLFQWSTSGFNSAWQRAMAKYEAAGGERFNEHDIRAVAATDADSLEQAQQLLMHQDPKTTARVYRRGAVNVEALKG